MEKRVLVTGTSVSAELLGPLLSAGLEIDNPAGNLSESDLRERLRGCVAYLLGGDEVATASALENSAGLKVIAFLGVGYSSFVDAKAAGLRGIMVTNTPGTLTQSVAEFAVAQSLNAVREIPYFSERARSSHLERDFSSDFSPYKTHEVRNLTVGVLGLGAIGTRYAEIVRSAFGSRVLYASRTRKPDVEGRLGITHVALGELFASCDLVGIFVPGDDNTKGLVGENELSLCRSGCRIINISKSSVLDPVALLRALESDRVSVATFDQFYDAGVAEAQKLLSLGPERVIITPHLGSLTNEARDNMARKAVQSILNILACGNDDYVVNSSQAGLSE